MGEVGLSSGPSPQEKLPWQAVLGDYHTTGCVPVMGGHSWALQLICQSENTTLLFPKPELCVTIQRPESMRYANLGEK